MIPAFLERCFWDVERPTFDPTAYPRFSIERILEEGDPEAVRWMRRTFGDEEVARVVRSSRRLSRRTANFWALVLEIPPQEVACLSKPSPRALETRWKF